MSTTVNARLLDKQLPECKKRGFEDYPRQKKNRPEKRNIVDFESGSIDGGSAYSPFPTPTELPLAMVAAYSCLEGSQVSTQLGGRPPGAHLANRE